MPELPDVEIFKNYLEATSLHKEIEDVHVRSPEMLAGTSPSGLKKAMKGTSLQSAHRHGKYLFCRMDTGKHLVLHFGMTGFLKYFKNKDEEPSHVRLLLDFSNGYHLAYDCSRKLGKIELIDGIPEFIREKELGPDPLQPDFDFAAFKEAFKGSTGAIKPALMNQRYIAGIGNIYSDEILFQAGIHPKTFTGQLDESSLKKLYSEMEDHVLPEAIKAGARPDRLPSSFIIPHRSKDGECPACGGKIVKETISGRSGYYCPRCQGNQSR